MSSQARNSSSKRKSAFDLKNQLSDLQNKLAESQHGGMRNTSTEIDPSGENTSIPRLPNVFGKKTVSSRTKVSTNHY